MKEYIKEGLANKDRVTVNTTILEVSTIYEEYKMIRKWF